VSDYGWTCKNCGEKWWPFDPCCSNPHYPINSVQEENAQLHAENKKLKGALVIAHVERNNFREALAIATEALAIQREALEKIKENANGFQCPSCVRARGDALIALARVDALAGKGEK
jgi:tRNA(Ile)-lysidine synthase TilS/MesJ